ncbi:MAG: hypothetical protein ABIO46_01460 [Chitinophagales bacterium]
MCCSLAVKAQNKNSIHASVFLPFVGGNPLVGGAHGTGFNLGYQYSVSKNLSLGGEYRLITGVNRWKGGVICKSGGDVMTNISFHDFDVKGRWCVNPTCKWSVIISMAVGYSRSMFTWLYVEQTIVIDGYNLTPSIELNRKIKIISAFMLRQHILIFTSLYLESMLLS